MTVASAFRGLTDVAYARFAPEDPVNRFAAAYPTFRTFSPPGGSPRDEIVLLRRSAASAPTARQLGAMAGGLPVWSETDVPAVFRALNPAGVPTQRAFPTFSLGQSGGRQFMNVVTFRAGFSRLFAPLTALGFDPADPATVMASAHAFARAHGFEAGIPTFNVNPTGANVGHEIIAFPATGAFTNSDTLPVMPGGTPAPSPWTFESVPVINDAGFALTSNGNAAVFLNAANGELTQFEYLHGTGDLVAVDPFVDGSHQSHVPIDSMVSAVATTTNINVIWSGGALFHAERLIHMPDLFTFRVASGRTAPDPTGLVGYFNHLAVGPADDLHALAYLSAPPGTPLSPALDDRDGYNLIHLSFDGASWTQETVDGEADSPLGHVVGNAGQMSALAFEPDGRTHAFYHLAAPPAGTSTINSSRLRHAVRTPAGWVAETLDGSGAATPPPTSGTGPTRANVGANPTAAFFDGSLWVVYEDRTWGNLRCARGTRDAGGTLRWTFHVVDGNAGPARTRGVVQSAVFLVWAGVLSLFYADMTAGVIRHAWRHAGDSQWQYERLDGAGGPDGRISGSVVPPIVAHAAGARPDGTTPLRVFVAYHWSGGQGSNIRLATLENS